MEQFFQGWEVRLDQRCLQECQLDYGKEENFLGRCFQELIERKLLDNFKLIILPEVFAFRGAEFQRKRLLGLALVRSLKTIEVRPLF